MIEIRQTDDFSKFMRKLKDKQARASILSRISRLQDGLMGDIKPVGGGVSELRVHVGAGYRVYIAQKGKELIILLCGGDKSTQKDDIKRAKELAKS